MNVIVLAEQLRRRVPGGIGTYVRGILDAAAARTNDSRPGGDRAGRTLTLHPWASGPIGRDALTMRMPSPVASRLIARGILRWPARRAGTGFEVAHATSLLVPDRRRGRPRVTVFVHDLAWRTHPESFTPQGRRWHESALGRAYTRADRFLVPSAFTADALVEAGFPPHLIHVAAEGADHLPMKERSPEEYLLSVSTLEPRKNLARVISAYERSGVGIPLKVVGPVGWGEALGPSQPKGVELVGAVPDDRLAELYAGALGVLYVPLTEGFGLPAVEAMRAGCPVIASPIPSTGEAALRVDPLDVGAIAAAIGSLVRSESLRTELTASGLAHTAGLTWAACLEAHRTVWSDLCGL